MKPYPTPKSFDQGYLSAGEDHNLYYEQAGNPNGQPVVYLHGGPGAGCSFKESKYFNPDHYRVIMFDQRGAGKSKPYASVQNNSIADLIGDIEKIRNHLNIKKWFVVGGSWGSTLALLYAKKHPKPVERMLLRGICYADLEGSDHLIEDGYANKLRHDFFTQYQELIPESQRENGLKEPYYNLLVHGSREESIEAAMRFDLWDTSIATYEMNHECLQEIRDNPEASLSLSKIFFHFATHEFSAQNKNFILSADENLANIPIDIIHGEDDYICPVKNAFEFHTAFPHAQLHIVPKTGHAMVESGLEKKLLEITQRWIADSQHTNSILNPSTHKLY